MDVVCGDGGDALELGEGSFVLVVWLGLGAGLYCTPPL